ncbi:amino acid ABC transporter substrate-binding protein (plasmid) [Rhizobium sp. Pop5]|uniref:amino acid ABC transporter substrate-binding protein n=1 Tax=Rhizobium sp. Pop5 TaxID=1223565 RepID=UPI0021573131|nr:amino acid ABC transporter substrate-binding protein [Rhizobium sp. Pop5]UVD60421.1 amino acid ABC transporter substrate-binding protein [Rhizobium sp. Pop5]
MRLTRRSILAGAGSAAVLAAGFSARAADDRKSVKIGYVVSKTGVNAPGAGSTTIPNYELWAADVKAAGGLKLPDGSRLPIEVVAYDDRSTTEEVVRGIERLARQDKVDFILPPWGTAFNLAVAPLMDRFGYPQLIGTSLIPDEIDVHAKWKRSFWFLGAASGYASTFADAVKAAGDATNKKLAIISVADGFGIELVKEARLKLPEAGLEIVMDKSYPIGTQDFTGLLNEVAASGADVFMALSYPPDSFAIAKQARLNSFNPKVFYTGVGTSFPIYSDINEGKVEGVMSLGGIDNSRPEMQAYVARHKKLLGTPPDYWASSVIYTSLQILQQAIERRGLDRDAVTEEIASGSFETIIGNVKLKKNRMTDLWLLGQWQGGKFVGVGPADRAGAVKAVIPKPAWA